MRASAGVMRWARCGLGSAIGGSIVIMSSLALVSALASPAAASPDRGADAQPEMRIVTPSCGAVESPRPLRGRGPFLAVGWT